MKFKNISPHGVYVPVGAKHIFIPTGGEVESQDMLVHPHIAEIVMERARDDEGQFVADDTSTPNVNEAWVEADKKPVEKVVKKKSSLKKTS